MKAAVLYSGGKDSTYALEKTLEKEEVAALVSMQSENAESYMYHTPNVSLVSLQAKAMQLPLILKKTKGEKEKELFDLRDALSQAVREYGVEAAVTGAVESVYQAQRIQEICDELDLWCFNPLWKKDQEELLDEILEAGYEVMISGVFAYPLGGEWLGRILDAQAVDELLKLREAYGISPSGEGGEIETTVLDAPMFKKRICVDEHVTEYRNHCGTYVVKSAHLVQK